MSIVLRTLTKQVAFGINGKQIECYLLPIILSISSMATLTLKNFVNRS